jgi:hypothetical protein
MNLLEYFIFFDDDSAQPDSPLSPLLLPFDGQNDQPNYSSLNIANVDTVPEEYCKSMPTVSRRISFKEIYTDDQELLTPPVERGVFLNRIVQSPIPVCFCCQDLKFCEC